ncbi:hypothetical protein BU14_0510s0010 [Porphyra umbilicalis]|uniref:Uncharacterized protein n=1 Tax=Porphyra umbilicalis TaxID=2786 RepID=A0A1X6NTH5_PORUM|nr:hypothetical protein BU14_0510s0010 [Porphyra umbilicalis]|eukprot:OSX71693.1 hypothetical protein BU14_0510s0010 [Porphyra umbilicalis]
MAPSGTPHTAFAGTPFSSHGVAPCSASSSLLSRHPRIPGRPSAAAVVPAGPALCRYRARRLPPIAAASGSDAAASSPPPQGDGSEAAPPLSTAPDGDDDNVVDMDVALELLALDLDGDDGDGDGDGDVDDATAATRARESEAQLLAALRAAADDGSQAVDDAAALTKERLLILKLKRDMHPTDFRRIFDPKNRRIGDFM